jgi:two-component system LytT family response regulator
MILKCIAVEDEPLALDIVKDYVSRIPFLKLADTFNEAMGAIEFLTVNDIDLIFLDIEMGGLSGTQLLKTLHKKPKVIITTAYRNYAFDAFELDVTDYLLKPFTFERFLKAVEKVYDLLKAERESSAAGSPGKDYFFVKSNYKMQKINFSDILYIKGLSEYIMIKTKSANVITLQSFKNIEKILPGSQFIRVHKSYLVAIDKIDCIEGQNIRIGNNEIPIGNKYKKIFFEVISALGK